MISKRILTFVLLFRNYSNISKCHQFTGDYTKAILYHEEMALLGKDELKHLFQVIDILVGHECYNELAAFIQWASTNSSLEVSLNCTMLQKLSKFEVKA